MKKVFCIICTIIFIYNLCTLPSAATISHDDIAILREDITKRGEYEKHYILEDGSYLAALYSEPVCYKDEKGNWIEIDNSIEKSGDKYKNKNSQLQVSFSKNASEKEMVNLYNNNNSLTWGLSFESVSNIETSKQTNSNMQKIVSPNASKIEYTDVFEKEDDITAAKNIESHVSYKNIYSNTVDVKYTVLPEKVKENIIINEPSDFTSYSMNIICDDLIAILTKDNSVEFVDKTGKLQYEILSPYMYDDIYELSYNINIEVKESTDGYIITFTPDKDWINSLDRVYPIVIDPTVRTGTAKANFSDTYIYEGSTASESRALEERLRVGIYNSLIYRVLWKTSVLPTLPTGASISSATFNLKFPSVTTTSRTFSLYKINSSWASYTVTWASANSLSTSLLKSGVSRNSSANTLTFSGTSVTNAIKSWYSGTANNGFLIRYTSESLTNPDYNVFYSSDNTTSTSYKPYLAITYTTATSGGNSSGYENFTGILEEQITVNGITLPIGTPMRYGFRYISQEGAPGYSGSRIDSVNFRSEYWGNYSSFAGCAVSSVSTALFTLGIDMLPKELCAINDTHGDPVVMQWDVVANLLGASCVKEWTSDIDTYLQRYLNNPNKYSAPIIKVDEESHYVTIVGKISNGVYKALDSCAHSAYNYTKGAQRVIQYCL